MAQLSLIPGREFPAATANPLSMDPDWSLPSGTACCAVVVLSGLGWAAVLLTVAL
ncbi:hypothetical protein LHP98_17730 [Rhodobacter sp. Har01]|uniref:hypothetical protein n=1 Tax=Rhodobacter sp. Har01 TaxID=2883999 RepID=UPI001D08F71C|nr:hypothetical protein [Rhodobacter sp. Har01]MCB6179963.1 hypothetical protein [Rhodobacter sp. Har01]